MRERLIDGNGPSGACWPCPKCHPDDGFKCWFRGHLAYCEDLNLLGQPCGMVYPVARGCIYHPYGMGGNRNTQPCRDPFTSRRSPAYSTHEIVTADHPRIRNGPHGEYNRFWESDFARRALSQASMRSQKSEHANEPQAESSSAPAAEQSDAPQEPPETIVEESAESSKAAVKNDSPSTVSKSTNSSASGSSNGRKSKARGRSRQDSYSSLACGVETSTLPLAGNVVRGH